MKVEIMHPRQRIARFIFWSSTKIRGLAYWIFPESSEATVGFGFDGVKVRVGFYRKYIDYHTEDAGMPLDEWYKIVIRVNNYIDNYHKENQ
jgi:flavin-dependent dehydrogenase